jgi:hypothetical protein
MPECKVATLSITSTAPSSSLPAMMEKQTRPATNPQMTPYFEAQNKTIDEQESHTLSSKDCVTQATESRTTIAFKGLG